MSKPIGVFAADTHLTEKTWLAPGRDIVGDAYASFKQLIDFALAQHLPLVLAGDVLERAVNTSSPITFAFEQLDRLHAADLQVFYIQGQHDEATPPWLSGHQATTHVNNTAFKLNNVPLYGLDYHPAGLLQIAMSNIPADTDVLVSHQVWLDFCGDAFGPQGSFGDVPVVNNVFTGDLHQFKQLKTVGRDGQKLTVISPGATHRCSIDEPDEHYFCVLYDDLTWKRVSLKTRPRLNYTLSAEGDLEAMLSQLNDKLEQTSQQTADYSEIIRKPLLWVKAAAGLEKAESRIRAASQGWAHLFFKELPPPPPPQAVARRQRAVSAGQKRAATLHSELHDYLISQNQEFLEADARRLLDAPDVSGELQKLRAEALNSRGIA